MTAYSCYNTTEIDYAIVLLCKIKEDSFLLPLFLVQLQSISSLPYQIWMDFSF